MIGFDTSDVEEEIRSFFRASVVDKSEKNWVIEEEENILW